ncbi:protein FAR1-RELATED SEQUENCE 5-like [Aegilops tauschii subsp. strangulata]|uniref:protein FAR1-RELATED SEQUENCE 5-like n=1 Tax=Aegilops tauschii subsp. strangulata TaxID=200361 RepID=UPI003CC8C3E3
MAQYLRSQREVTEAHIANAEVAKSAGISNKATFDLMAKEACGSENLGFIRDDLKICLYSKRTIKAKNGDTGGVLEYMEKKVSEDVNFFYSIQVDEDEMTRKWKQDDGRPFGLIVGVNNHQKTVVFGAALFYDETAASFAWLFRTFLKVMSGKHPRTILTDENAAMAKAIRKVFPHSHHRICVWHMNQNACKHLAGVVDEYKKFNVDFQHCIYDIEEEDEFVSAWNKMIDKYELGDNAWLQRLFEKKEQWALVYGKNTFSAHMSTTQRSESMNNELKRYISVKYDMLTFFEHFERLVSDKRCEEVKYDFKATQTTPKLKAESSYMLTQAAATYAPAIFKIFQDQVLRTLNYDTLLCDESDTELKIYVLDINNIKHIPGKYILKRWTIDAKVLDITSKCNPHENLKARMSNRYKELCRMFLKIAARAAESEDSYNKAAKFAEQLAQDVDKCLKIRADPDLGDSCTKEVAAGVNIPCSRISKHNDGLAKPKGMKVKEKTIKGSKRPVGGFEKATSKKKRNTDDIVQLEPHGTSKGHPTDHMSTYLQQQNSAQPTPIQNATMQPSTGSSDRSHVYLFTAATLDAESLSAKDHWNLYL